jgi:hypothetical protein
MKKPECINPLCNKPQHSRGLCMGCYRTATRLIEEERVTEKELIDAGKIWEPRATAKSKWFEGEGK